MNEIVLTPIGIVKNSRADKTDANWSAIVSEIELADYMPVEAFDSIESFSHLEIIYYLDRADKTILGSEHPRENPEWPKVGILAQRKKDRPNHLGLTIVNLLQKKGRRLFVSNLDAIDGTPVLDIKPVYQEYLPKGKIRQPDWTRALMKNYWRTE
ncbi:MAG: tRNA (N6-threonylcarbamoyladenosine(37)-N6)-methyltransferase TrmO [Bacteroidetes bacterium]|nr:MAG: tRNA (N6-threonylcarbamoyladenosine(37)-N6)-methyltransferase TrmO [Bacteroidota bacterium]